jgi:hypothetical protein
MAEALKYAPEPAQGSGRSTGGGGTPDVSKLPIPSAPPTAVDRPCSGTFNGLGIAVNQSPEARMARGEQTEEIG